ncbi:amidohydrolase family protein [Bordetella bronchiseptica]
MDERACVAEGGGWDCHFHVFDASRYTLAAGSAYQPEDASLAAFRGVCRARGIGRAVLVHPSVYGADHSSYEDALAANGDWLRGVAVVYPDEATTPDARIEHWDLLGTAGTRINRLFPGAPQHPERIVERVKPFGWHVQVLTDIVEDIGLLRQIAARDVPVVVDHFGHHPHERLLRSAGWQDLLALVREGAAWVKLSAPYRVGAQGPTWAGAQALVDQLVQANPRQLVWGSDWPHPPDHRHPFPAPDQAAIGATIAQWLPDAPLRRQVMELNPLRLYGGARAAGR